jgi:hypothetical protein
LHAYQTPLESEFVTRHIAGTSKTAEIKHRRKMGGAPHFTIANAPPGPFAQGGRTNFYTAINVAASVQGVARGEMLCDTKQNRPGQGVRGSVPDDGIVLRNAVGDRRPRAQASRSPADVIQEHIRRRAHELWLDGAMRTGHVRSDWLQAEQEVLALHVAVHTQSSLNRRPPPQRFARVTAR